MPNFTFAELLKGFRKRASMSQEELAAVIGCSCTTVSNWERAQTVPEDRDLVLALGQELSLRSIEGDQLLAAADFAPKPMKIALVFQ